MPPASRSNCREGDLMWLVVVVSLGGQTASSSEHPNISLVLISTSGR